MRTLFVGVVVLVLSACPPASGPVGGSGGGSAIGGGSAVGGGAAATGGGTATTGGGAATGGDGGGSTTTGGVGTFLLPGFYDHFMASGADGRVHLVFVDGAAQNIHYGSCASNCGDATSWNELTLATATQLGVTTAGPVGFGRDATGRLHLVVGGVAASGTANETIYASCVGNCHDVANWNSLDLSSLSPGDSPVSTEQTVNVTSTGRVSFFSMGGRYLSCDGNCDVLSSWSSGQALSYQPIHARLGADGTTHVLAGEVQSGEHLLHYARCASNCQEATNWSVSPLGFRTTNGLFTTGMAVTASGRIIYAYNQGRLPPPVPNDNRLLLTSCAGTGCLDLTTWTTVVLGVSEEGEDGVSLVAQGESVVATSATNSEVNLFGCDGACQTPANWVGPQVVDTADAIAQVITPQTGLGCPSATGAAWWPRGPVVHATPAGELVVVHNPRVIGGCNGSIRTSPPIGRVISTF